MRGKEPEKYDIKAEQGITPAYAGKRDLVISGSGDIEDHPPRMRGKVYLVQLYCGFARITPAYAGKSASTNADRFSVQDHPRVCGEKAETERTQRGVPGSPPRMRGKVGHDPAVRVLHRITPAYAGKRTGCKPCR